MPTIFQSVMSAERAEALKLLSIHHGSYAQSAVEQERAIVRVINEQGTLLLSMQDPTFFSELLSLDILQLQNSQYTLTEYGDFIISHYSAYDLL